jgi:hypothetical protein
VNVRSRGSRLLRVLGLAAGFVVLAAAPGSGETQRSDPEPTPTPLPALTPTPPKRSGAGLKDAPAPGNSLADVVRRSQAEKEKQPKKKSLGVITNEEVKKPAAEGAKEGAKTVRVGKGKPVPTPAKTPFPTRFPELRDSKGRTESDWKRMAADARIRLARAQAHVKQVEGEAKRLENDFYAWSDGNYREQKIKPAWDQALDQLKKARIEVEDARQALLDLEDEARKSDAPPGWLRE